MCPQERKWGGLTERLLVATAASYVVSPGAPGVAAVGAFNLGGQSMVALNLYHYGRSG
jgi:hypothetical protein